MKKTSLWFFPLIVTFTIISTPVHSQQTSGSIVWFTALILTWALSGIGFYYIYKAGKAA